MSTTPDNITLTTPTDGEMLSKIRLKVGTVMELTGVSRRQIEYWTDLGALTPDILDNNERRYDMHDLRKAALMLQAAAQGCGIEDAAYLAECHLENEEQSAPVSKPEPVAPRINPEVIRALGIVTMDVQQVHAKLDAIRRELYRQA